MTAHWEIVLRRERSFEVDEKEGLRASQEEGKERRRRRRLPRARRGIESIVR